MNELASANQCEFEQQLYNQNVSSFYDDNLEEEKSYSDNEAPLRLTNKSDRDNSPFCPRGKEIEMQNPIMHMMQMHEHNNWDPVHISIPSSSNPCSMYNLKYSNEVKGSQSDNGV